MPSQPASTRTAPAGFAPTACQRTKARSVDASVAGARSTTTTRKHRQTLVHRHATRRGRANTSTRLPSAALACWAGPTPTLSTLMEKGTAAGVRIWNPSARTTSGDSTATTWKPTIALSAGCAPNHFILTSWRCVVTPVTLTSCLIAACAMTTTVLQHSSPTLTATTSDVSDPTDREACSKFTATCRFAPPLPQSLAFDVYRARRPVALRSSCSSEPRADAQLRCLRGGVDTQPELYT